LKKAYRSLSLQFHPDRQASTSTSGSGGQGQPPDHSKFQEIQNAYETLSDPERRDEYDHFGEKGARGGMGGMDQDDFMNSFMDQMFGGGGMGGGPPPSSNRPRQRRKTQTPPSSIDLHLTLEELYCGCPKRTIAIERTRTCFNCKGSGARLGKQAKACVKCDGQGQTFAMRTMGAYMVRQPVMCSACQGRGIRVRDQDQ
jgi:DnaJ family protein A protein 2